MPLTHLAELHPMETLRQLLETHHVAAVPDGRGEWLHLPRGCRARAVLYPPTPERALQLDVAFEPWRGAYMLESFGGFGSTSAQQRQDAWRGFLERTFHVLLASLLYRDDAPVERAGWEIDGELRAITIGSAVTRGAPPPLAPWWDAARAVVERSALPTGLHWIRVFVAHVEGGDVHEVLLDNAPWPDAQRALAEVPWPDGAREFSASWFLVVQGGLDVSRALADLMNGHELDDEALAARLIERGVEPEDADLLIAMLSTAFGRALHASRGISFSPHARVRSRSTGAERLVRLDEHPIFAEASRLARDAVLAPDARVRVALRSAEARRVWELDFEETPTEAVPWSAPVFSVP